MDCSRKGQCLAVRIYQHKKLTQKKGIGKITYETAGRLPNLEC